MSDDILSSLATVLGRWTIGGPADADAPAPWRELLDEHPDDAELRLLALAGHWLDLCVVADPAEPPRATPDLPRLDIPVVSDDVRPLVRRALASSSGDARDAVVGLVVARGRAPHPADWLPTRGSAARHPALAAWSDWVGTGSDPSASTSVDDLTADTWDVFAPSSRVVALTALRERDPDAARAVIAAKIAGESPDHRLVLVGILERGLVDDDREVLSLLLADHAPRVRSAAAALMARLGAPVAAAEDDVAELVGFVVSDTTGLLRRGRRVRPVPLKTPAQHRRRRELFEAVELVHLATALGMTSAELLTAWQWGEDAAADRSLAAAVARGGSDDLVDAVVGAVEEDPGSRLPVADAVLERLAPERRVRLARRGLGAPGGSFVVALRLAGPGTIDDPLGTAAGSELLARVGADGARPGDAADELSAVGLVASRSGASAALDRWTRAGRLAADPRLDILRLNAALDDKGDDR